MVIELFLAAFGGSFLSSMIVKKKVERDANKIIRSLESENRILKGSNEWNINDKKLNPFIKKLMVNDNNDNNEDAVYDTNGKIIR